MRHIPAPLVFEYAIKFPDGQYYTGPDYVGVTKVRTDKADNRTRIPSKVFCYAEKRVHEVIANNPQVFEGCVVERFV